MCVVQCRMCTRLKWEIVLKITQPILLSAENAYTSAECVLTQLGAESVGNPLFISVNARCCLYHCFHTIHNLN